MLRRLTRWLQVLCVLSVAGAGAALAEPSWARSAHQLRKGTASPSAAWELFNEADAKAAPAGPFLLVCRVDVSPTSRFDSFADPDLLVGIRLGRTAGGAEHHLLGREDTPSAYVAIPGARLASGERLRVTVFDRDVTEDELIGAAQPKYEGALPLTFRGDHFTGECRAADPARVEQLLGACLQEVDRKLLELERSMKVDLRAHDLGEPRYRTEIARWALRDCAGLVGWERAEVKGRVERADALGERWRKLRANAVRAAARTVDAPGTEVELEAGVFATVKSARCSLQAGCVLQLSVRNAGARPAELGGRYGRGRYLSGVVLHGAQSDVTVRMPAPARVSAGSTVQVKLTGECLDGGCAEQPLLVRLGFRAPLLGAAPR